MDQLTLRPFRFDELEEIAARGVRMQPGDGPADYIIVRQGPRVFAYRNRCPHTGVSLEWLPNQFLSLDGGYLQCATHGALFRLDNGYCVRGPCAGQSLQSLEVRLRDGWVELVPEARTRGCGNG